MLPKAHTGRTVLAHLALLLQYLFLEAPKMAQCLLLPSILWGDVGGVGGACTWPPTIFGLFGRVFWGTLVPLRVATNKAPTLANARCAMCRA